MWIVWEAPLPLLQPFWDLHPRYPNTKRGTPHNAMISYQTDTRLGLLKVLWEKNIFSPKVVQIYHGTFFLKMPLNKSKQVPTFNKDLQLHLPKIGGFFAHWAPNSFPTQKQSELPCNTVREKSWPAIYISTWWLNQPNWKILVKLDHSPSPGENKRYLKPPTFNHIDIQKGFIPTGCL